MVHKILKQNIKGSNFLDSIDYLDKSKLQIVFLETFGIYKKLKIKKSNLLILDLSKILIFRENSILLQMYL